MRSPPSCVAFVARTHGVVGLVILGSIGLLHLIVRRLPVFEFGPQTYLIAGSLAGLYLVAGALVWFGVPPGRFLSRVCALLYLARQPFGSLVWETMNEPEFKAHFLRSKT